MAECTTRTLPRCAGRCPCTPTRSGRWLGEPNEISHHLLSETNEVGGGRFAEFFQNTGGEVIVPCSCMDRARPVCGEDGETYRNPCLAKCKTGGKFRKKCWGTCPCKTGNSAS